MRGPHNIIRLIRTGATFERTGAMKVVLDALDAGPLLRMTFRGLVWPLQWLGFKGNDAMPPVPRALTALGPAYIKFGQVLSTRPDVVGADMAEELRILQDALPPFSMAEARAEVKRELGVDVDDVFSTFSEPVAAASLAQVHKAHLADSVFGEMLTFRKLLEGAKTKQERKVLLAGKVEDMINTVVRQIAFYDFECKLHAARAQGELTPDDINALWMSVQAESLGDVFDFQEGYETFWAYIPHFVHSPFYVYAYAFGDGLVNALYAVYEEGDPDFKAKYFDMLKAGGSKHHKELLAPFGLDASDPAFWDKGLSMISGFIDELEKMEE